MFCFFSPTPAVTLVPDESFEVGQEVRRVRKLLDSIKAEVITFGIIMHPDLSVTGCKIPFRMQKQIRGEYVFCQYKTTC